MNPITNIKNLNKINDREIALGVAGQAGKSWHQKYADSAWIFVGGLPYNLTEGDIIAVFSQYGEIVNINLIRDQKTGKSKGFGFICFEDQRSTILSVDNLNGTKLLGRMVRVDHVEEYKVPKYREDVDEDIRKVWEEGCAPKPINIPEEAAHSDAEEEEDVKPKNLDNDGLIPLNEAEIEKGLKAKIDEERQKRKDEKKEKKRLKKEKKRMKKEKRRRKDSSSDSAEDADGVKKVKKEPADDVRDLTRSWKDQRKGLVDERPTGNDDEFYGSNSAFNFNKERKEIPPPPTHNVRPNFEKADWRDIEMWKHEREREKRIRGEYKGNWKEEEHYLPTRFNR
uniref:RRM domain-containing protein n=1 Tax=Plectus sambesii TaxID=2011161 RepID=A0A914WHQ7_9BILA